MRDAIAERLGAFRLRLHEHKTHVSASRCGLRFLGFVLYPGERRLQQSALARFNRRIRWLRWARRHGRMRTRHVGDSVRAWLAHAAQANCHGVTSALLGRARF